MRERPILFSGPMVRAILEGKKTQTRRILKHDTPSPLTDKFGPMKETCDPGYWVGCDIYGTAAFARCPFGAPGDRLWVRETAAFSEFQTGLRLVNYRATPDGETAGIGWKPSIFMPRWASRLTLEVKAVRVERLQEISEADARAEGIVDGGCLGCGNGEPCGCADPKPDARDSYAHLWDSLNGKKAPWLSNPWVWVVEFERVTA